MKVIKKNKRSTINEALGNRIAVRSLRHFGFRAHKISDVMGTSFTDKKPYDIFSTSPNGVAVAIEGKIIKTWKKLNYKDFQAQQMIELDGNCLKCKGRSFVFLYVMIKGKNELCVIDWKVYHKQIKSHFGVSVSEIRNKDVGCWYEVTKDSFDKDIYNLKGFLK